MLIGYWRNWPSGPKKQREKLEAAGCERVYGESSPRMPEPLAELAEAVRTLRPGDEIVVVAPEVLGRTQAEILAAMTDIHRLTKGGAAIRDLSTGEAIRYHPDMHGPLDFVARGAAALGKRKMTAANEASRTKSGRKKALVGKRKAAAEKDWRDMSLTGPQVAEKYGLSVQALHNYFGARSKSSS